MDIFAKRLKERAQQLGISDRQAARLCELDERRYAHYAGGRREPDLQTVVDIARALAVSPNWLLGVDNEAKRATKRSALLDRLLSAAQGLSDEELRIVTVQAEALLRAG